MDDRVRLIEELDAAREKMQKILAGFDTEQEIYPGWTLKHFLAHVTGWDEAVTLSLRAYVNGESSAIASYRGIDDYNARSVETRTMLNYAQTYREWEIARDALKDAIRAVSEAQMAAQDVVAPWGDRGSVRTLVEVLIYHEHGHSRELQDAKLKPKFE